MKTREKLESKKERRKLRSRAARYTFIEGKLYKRSFAIPYIKCLTEANTEYELKEVHEGVHGNHLMARTIADKLIREGYYWPMMKKNVEKLV